MNIHYISQKIKAFALNENVLIGFVIISVAILAFVLGRYSISKNEEDNSIIIIEKNGDVKKISDIQIDAPNINKNTASEKIYASVNGTKYYFESCGSSNIKEENKVWFKSPQEAENNGYTLASICQ
jgi:hypothetical protein